MKFTKKVKCTKTYVEDGNDYWTAGQVYDAKKHQDGSWSIETNFGTVGKVGEEYMLDDFSSHFLDVTREMKRNDAAR